jgi:hypothetical protein
LIGLPGIPLEYVARVNGNQAEVHEGFKGFVIRDEANGYGWYVNIHAETGDLHRVCTRKHTVTVLVTKLDTGELVAQLGYKGDFGASIGNKEIAPGKSPVIQTPNMPGMTCDDQLAILQAAPNLSKKIRVANIDNGGYENWHGGLNSTLGLTAASWFKEGMIIDIRNPGTSCPDVACASLVPNNSHGDNRAIILYQSHLKYSVTNDTLNGSAADGYFYTDVYGTTLFDSPGVGRVKQFIKPGLDIDGPDGGYNQKQSRDSKISRLLRWTVGLRRHRVCNQPLKLLANLYASKGVVVLVVTRVVNIKIGFVNIWCDWYRCVSCKPNIKTPRTIVADFAFQF